MALWSFIGVEGAVALSGRAKNKRDVGKATLIGFVVSLIICLLVSILPFGVLTQHELSAIPSPSTAGILKIVVGEWGKIMIILGVLISVLTSWLAWTIVARTAYGGRAERHIPETVQQKKCEGFGLGFALYKQCVYANRRTSGLLF